MLSNREIKSKEIYKAKQKLLRVKGEFKQVQNDLLIAMNECALSEYRHDNKLKQGVIALKCKNAISRYMRVYGEMFGIEEHLSALYKWEPKD